MLRKGLTVAQVVRGYGEICRAITDLAVEQEAHIAVEELRTLNRCLEDATAEAVTAFVLLRDRLVASEAVARLDVLAHELRNLLGVATLAFDNIQTGRVAARGSMEELVDRSLLGMRNLIDESFVVARFDVGVIRPERIRVAELLEEIEAGAFPEVRERDLRFVVTPAGDELFVEGDRAILAATITRLLQNAFEFTAKCSLVSLTTRATADRVLFEIEDECGGLAPATTGVQLRELRELEQCGYDHSGRGVGLASCLEGAAANGGSLRVRDLAGKGCVFTLDVPRR